MHNLCTCAPVWSEYARNVKVFTDWFIAFGGNHGKLSLRTPAVKETTLFGDVVEAAVDELDAQYVAEGCARRLRMHLGDQRLSVAALARTVGMDRRALGRKLKADGTAEFTLTELVTIAKALGLRWDWVLTGAGHHTRQSEKTAS
jgi:DNA-binding phage protein